MATSGFASRNNFRKHLSSRSIKSKYQTIVKTAEEIEAEELEI